jgi:hypothetical protein
MKEEGARAVKSTLIQRVERLNNSLADAGESARLLSDLA